VVDPAVFGGELAVEGEHLFDQGNNPVMALPVRRVGKVVPPVYACFCFKKRNE